MVERLLLRIRDAPGEVEAVTVFALTGCGGAGNAAVGTPPSSAAVIGVRVGRLLVYVANREALGSFLDAWGKAAALADKAFGPDLPSPRVGESITAD